LTARNSSRLFGKVATINVTAIYCLALVLPAIETAGGYNQVQLGLGKTNPGIWVLFVRERVGQHVGPSVRHPADGI
jgi:hypothetical protein